MLDYLVDQCKHKGPCKREVGAGKEVMWLQKLKWYDTALCWRPLEAGKGKAWVRP